MRAVLAELAGPSELLAALRALRGRRHVIDAFTPYPVHGAEEAMDLPRTRLPWLVLGAGLFGAAFAYLFQWWIQYDYPIDLGARPLDAAPAWIPVTFETAILCAALATFFGLLAFLGLPRLWHPVFEVAGFERATIDRCWVAVAADGQRDAVAEELLALGALQVVDVEDVA